MKLEKFAFLSSNKENIINALIWFPETQDYRGIIQILHGMADRIGRYDETAQYFTNQGFIVCGHDMIGHGDSTTEEYKGYISSNIGYLHLIEDTRLANNELKKRYQSLPIFLLGHSMGASVAKIYASKYGNTIDGLILSGTGDKTKGINLAIMLTKYYMKKKGEMAKATEVDKIAFKDINKRFAPAKTVSDWLSRDELMVQKFLNDPKCCFLFTNRGYLNMLYLIKNASKKKILLNIPPKLPIFIFTGSEDVSTKLGESTIKFYHRLIKFKKIEVSLKIYENGRHEMLNEINRNEVCEDIKNWLSKIY